MASEVKYAVTSFTIPATTGLFDVVIAGLGWTPKAIRITSAGGGVSKTAVDGVEFSIGFCDNVSQFATQARDANGLASVSSLRDSTNTACCMYGSSSYMSGVGAGAGAIANGWKLNALGISGIAPICLIEFFGGADLSANVHSLVLNNTGSTTKTGLSFQPTLLMSTGVGAGAENYSAGNSIISMAMACDDGVGVSQGGVLFETGATGNAVANPVMVYGDVFAGQVYNDSLTWKNSVSVFTSDGYTLALDSGSTASDLIFVLAIDTGDRKVAVKEINAPTSAASDWAVTGIGFKPQGVYLYPSMMEAADIDALKIDQKAGYYAAGASDGIRQHGIGSTVQDAATTTNSARVGSNQFAYFQDTSDAALFDIGLPTFDADGWTVAAADINTAQATQRKWLAFAIEEEAATVVECTLSGTATASITEDDITTGGKTIILTLTEDTWLTAGASFDATRQSIIDGLVSTQSETDGWNNSRSGIAVTDVVRTSDIIVTITLPAL